MICCICNMECGVSGMFTQATCQTVAKLLSYMVTIHMEDEYIGSGDVHTSHALILRPEYPMLTCEGYILHRDENGHITYTQYGSEEHARKAWDKLRGTV